MFKSRKPCNGARNDVLCFCIFGYVTFFVDTAIKKCSMLNLFRICPQKYATQTVSWSFGTGNVKIGEIVSSLVQTDKTLTN